MKDRISTVFKKAGFARVGFLNRQDARFGNWLQPWLINGYHADMNWMEKNMGIRSDPCSIEDYGRSIICLSYPYFTAYPLVWKNGNPISNYAWGEDYHSVLRKKLKTALEELNSIFPDFRGRSFVDSAPIPEKILAAKCGLGWIGKNSMLIDRKLGSYLFLAEIVCNLNLPSTPPVNDYCGNCSACIDACPTQAIRSEGNIDSRRCISYLTIEKRGQFTRNEEKSIGYHLFGCDICQQVCPWNNKITPIEKSPFQCSEKWLNIEIEELAEISEILFNQLKAKSPIKRAKLAGIRRNALAVLKNNHL